MAAWGLYVHIPFCPYKCAYCDFVAVADGPRVRRWHAPYRQALGAEAAYWRRVLNLAEAPVSVYYGGGTPSLWGGAALAALHRQLCACFGGAAAEVTVECNPGTVGAKDLEHLREAGVNRLSLGLQTPRGDLLAALGRRHTWESFLQAWSAARAVGFAALNVDLMVGLPAQRSADVRAALEAVLALQPEHVSVYGLQLEEGTPLEAQVRRGYARLPTEDEAAEQLDLCCRLLRAAGYEHYEISNFARPGYRCRHNLLYWDNGDYLGLGIGAHSHWQGRRWWNTTQLARYVGPLGGELPGGHAPVRGPGGAGRPLWVAGEEAPDPQRERSDAAFLGLRRLDEGLDERAFAHRYGVGLRAAFPGVLEDLSARGLLEEASPGRWRLTPSAVPIANRVFREFV